MKNLLNKLLCILGIILITQPQFVSAQFSEPVAPFNTSNESSDSSQSSLITSVLSITPGQTFKIALKLSPPQGWHSYYFNDGIGVPQVPAIEWILPNGFVASSLTFPTPHSMDSFGLAAFKKKGYTLSRFQYLKSQRLTRYINQK